VGLKLRSSKGAFSLLELLISIAILSSGIVIILQGFSFSTRSAALSCEVLQAVLLAKDKLQELEFKENNSLIAQENPDSRTTAGKFQLRFQKELNTELNLYTSSVDIRWMRSKRQETITFQTYLR
jgi:prepilin-type N-terminal cleavage/methylation domain-containing protein